MRLFSDATIDVDDPYLARALTLALKGRPHAAPNPLVGCVLVRDGRIVGEGYHAKAGEAHAEVAALAAAGDQAAGCTAYVTLEPCNHHGKTPPCTSALIEAAVSSVIVGMPDRTADAGGGAARLEAAGIKVTFADDPTPFESLNAGWLQRTATGLPRVVVKLATSLDGRIAAHPGATTAITGPSGAKVTQALRRRVDAILVGGSTAACDDPSLTVRDASDTPEATQPTRVVLAGSRMPESTCRLMTDDAAPTLFLLPESTLNPELPPHVTAVRYDDSDGVTGALRTLAALGVNDVLIEPGTRLFSAVWREGLIDELVTVHAGGVLGGCAVPAADEDAGAVCDPAQLDRLLVPVECGVIGDVAVTVWRRRDANDETTR